MLKTKDMQYGGFALSGVEYYMTASEKVNDLSITNQSNKIPKKELPNNTSILETSVYKYYSDQLQLLSSLFKIDIYVSSYLVNKFEFCEPLIQLEKEIKKQFENSKLVIKLVEDPEISNWVTLKIIIDQQLDFKTAHEKIQYLLTNWLYFQNISFRSAINISLF